MPAVHQPTAALADFTPKLYARKTARFGLHHIGRILMIASLSGCIVFLTCFCGALIIGGVIHGLIGMPVWDLFLHWVQTDDTHILLQPTAVTFSVGLLLYTIGQAEQSRTSRRRN